MARPKKDPGDQRTDRLNARLTSAERMAIEANAAFFGLSPSEFMRRRALDRRMPAARTDQKQAALMATALIRLGNNLNQIARHMNAGRGEPPGLAALIARIDAALDGVYDSPADDRGSELQGGGPLLSP